MSSVCKRQRKELKWGTVESNALLDVPIVIPKYADGEGH